MIAAALRGAPRGRAKSTCLAVLVSSACLAAAPPPPAPAELAGLRMDHYRAPVPETLRGARVLHSPALATFLAASHPILIDVLPAPEPPQDGRPGLPRLPLAHHDIPGSLWWPDIARAALAPPTAARLKELLRDATAGDTARRAVAYGYKSVIWAPDDWQAAGLPTVLAQPVRGVAPPPPGSGAP